MLVSPAHAMALPARDLALFQAGPPSFMAAGAALAIIRRRYSGCAGTAADSLPATRAMVLSAQHQFWRVSLGRSAVPIRAIRSAKLGWSALVKALRDPLLVAIRCLMMPEVDYSTNSLEHNNQNSNASVQEVIMRECFHNCCATIGRH